MCFVCLCDDIWNSLKSLCRVYRGGTYVGAVVGGLFLWNWLFGPCGVLPVSGVFLTWVLRVAVECG